MTDTTTPDAGVEVIAEKIRKLLAVAAKAGTPEEAETFAAKAQELLNAYNLDMTTIEQGGKEGGKREEQRLMGGMYVYERELWRAIAQLNFCVYFTTRSHGSKVYKGRKLMSFQHRIIGRVVNTAGVKSMAGYLQGVIERLCRERFPDARQFFRREAVAFREGMSDKICSRLRDRRNEVLREEDNKKRAAAAAAKASGINTAFALTLIDVKEAEERANYDFMHGEGAWQRRADRIEEWNKQSAERRAAEAKAEAEADAEYAKWAAANPEEAAASEAAARKEAEKKRKQENKRWERRSYRDRRERAPTAREKRAGSDYYDDGYEKGGEISLEPQVDSRENQKRISAS